MEASRHGHANDASSEKARPASPVAVGSQSLVAPLLSPAALAGAEAGYAPTLSHDAVIALQRTFGNQKVMRLIDPRVQRHPEGKSLTQAPAQIGEIESKASAGAGAAGPVATPQAPEATRTKEQETAQHGEAKTAGGAYEKANKLSPGAMSLASAQKILQGAFGGVKDIVPGNIEILADQPACAAKYDEVCMQDGVKRPDGSAWQKGDCAKDDAAAGVQTEGFAWKGVVYVNGKTTLVTATAHEMLHNNTAAGFRGKVGETLNEGFTETLARRALTASGVTVPAVTAYPDQVAIAGKVETLVTPRVVTDAYFGGADGLINKFEQIQGSGAWAALKTAAEALDTAKVDEAVKPKPKTGT